MSTFVNPNMRAIGPAANNAVTTANNTTVAAPKAPMSPTPTIQFVGSVPKQPTPPAATWLSSANGNKLPPLPNTTPQFAGNVPRQSDNMPRKSATAGPTIPPGAPYYNPNNPTGDTAFGYQYAAPVDQTNWQNLYGDMMNQINSSYDNMKQYNQQTNAFLQDQAATATRRSPYGASAIAAAANANVQGQGLMYQNEANRANVLAGAKQNEISSYQNYDNQLMGRADAYNQMLLGSDLQRQNDLWQQEHNADTTAALEGANDSTNPNGAANSTPLPMGVTQTDINTVNARQLDPNYNWNTGKWYIASPTIGNTSENASEWQGAIKAEGGDYVVELPGESAPVHIDKAGVDKIFKKINSYGKKKLTEAAKREVQRWIALMVKHGKGYPNADETMSHLAAALGGRAYG